MLGEPCLLRDEPVVLRSTDRGDGWYSNPVLYADYSDPDAIRVGGDYWMTASSFSHVPGLPILHSRDLVHWTLVGHALERLVPEEHFAVPRHGAGVWAPSLRFHEGLYRIYYPDPDFGIHLVTASDPRGPWSEPVLVLPGRGLIDPCPFWDDDGSVYLVHGWAKSRAGFNNRLTLHRLDPTGTRPLGDGIVIIDGDRMPGWSTIEGPKLYRRDGHYYLFAPAGGVEHGYQAVFRADRLEGPWEARVVLARGSTPVNGPHQGAWVDTPEGEHWFLHFQELPALGRVVHLQPMRWGEDGWPEMGAPTAPGQPGEPVLVHPKPRLPVQPAAFPPTSDAFPEGRFHAGWQFQCNPDPGWILPSDGNDGLRLRCVPLAADANLWAAGSLLLQKFPGPEFRAEVEIDAAGLRDGDRAGLVVFGLDYAWIGVERAGGDLRIVARQCAQADRGSAESVAGQPVPMPTGSATRLRVSVGEGARCRFEALDAAGRWTCLIEGFPARSSRWVGAKVGLFARAATGSDGGGSARFASFTVSGPDRAPTTSSSR